MTAPRTSTISRTRQKFCNAFFLFSHHGPVLGGPLLLRESGSTAVQLDTQMEPSTCYGVNHPVDRSKNNGLQQFRLVRRRKAAEPTWELEFRGCIFHPFYPRPLACEVEENHKVTYIYPSRRFSNCRHRTTPTHVRPADIDVSRTCLARTSFQVLESFHPRLSVR